MVATPILDREKSRSRKMTNGISGSLRLTDCQITNAAMNPIPPARVPQIHDAQCCDCPSCSANTSMNMPIPDSSTPSRSNRCVDVGSTGISQTANANPTMPTGTLTKKIHCHPKWSTSTPPASGPTSVATPAVAPHTLIATPRRSGGKIRVIVDSVCGVSRAAPMPCTTRAAISIPMLPARPHHSDAAVNTVRPSKYRFFGPNRSPSRPATSSGTA
jgi:hypothetical protein